MADLSKIRKNGVDYDIKDATARAAIEELKQNGTGGNANQGGGMSTTAVNLLVTILRNGVYNNDQSANITALESALASGGSSGGEEEPDEPVIPDEPDTTIYTITNNLTNVTSNNTAKTINKNEAYSAVLTAADGYKLDSVIVVMGGVDVTSTVYSEGNIVIGAVTGNVVITAGAVDARTILYNWDLTQSMTDSISGNVATVSGAIQDENGLSLATATDYASFPDVFTEGNRTIEIDVSYANWASSGHGRLAMWGRVVSIGVEVQCGFILRSGTKWALYNNTWYESDVQVANVISGKTVTLEVDSDMFMKAYVDGEFYAETAEAMFIINDRHLYIGSPQGNSFYNVTISAIRVYEKGAE